LGQVAAGDGADRGESSGDREEDRQVLSALTDLVGGDHDRQRRREQERGRGALEHTKDDDPGLASRSGRGGPAERGEHGERDRSPDHRAPVAQDVGDAPAEGEQRRQRQQVAVDDPLRTSRRELEIVLQVRDRQRDNRLVDEHHRDREDHRGQHQVLIRGAHHAALYRAAVGAWGKLGR
jgi:hypothetical protein